MASLVKSEPDGRNCCCCFNGGDLFSMLEPCKLEDMESNIIARLIVECYQIEVKSTLTAKHRDHFVMCKLCILRLKDAIQFRYQVQSAYDTIEGMMAEHSFSFASCNSGPNYGDFSLELETTADNSVPIKIEKKDITFNDECSNSDSHFSADDLSDAQDTKDIKRLNTFESEVKLPIEFIKKKSKFECEICRKSFISRAWFEKHCSQHTSERDNDDDDGKFICNDCGKRFSDKDILESHMSIHIDKKDIKAEIHPFDAKIYLCEICPKKFSTRRALRKHKQIHSDVIHVCEYCGKTYRSRKSLRAHYVKHLNDPSAETKMEDDIKQKYASHYCSHCNKSFGRLRALRLHLLRVNDIRNFQCDLCQKTFISKYNIQRHMRTHMSDRPQFLCNQCGKAFTRNNNLIKHMRLHMKKPYSCKVCGKTFTNKGKYESHKIAHDETIEKCPTCRYCFAEFTNAADLKKHHDTVCEGKKHECDFCKKKFMTAAALVLHSKTHEHGGVELICDYCGRTFVKRSNLLYHIRAHMKLETYQCELCPKIFHKKQSLKNHMKYHKAVRDYICQKCGQGFVQRSHLNMHMDSHFGIRNYRCEPCDKGFLRKYHLTKHLRTCPNIYKFNM